MNYVTKRFPNGLRLVTHEAPGMESVAVGIWIAVGSRYETEKIGGISHFLEHLLFKGTQTRSARELKEGIEGVGGSFNGFTSEEFTCYLVKMRSKYLRRALDILSDMVRHPALRAADIEKERPVVIEEIRMYQDMPSQHVHELLDGLLWPAQPLGRPIAGTVESLRGIGRPEVEAYTRRYYTARNMVVSVCGRFDQREVFEQVRRLLGGHAPGEASRYERARVRTLKPQIQVVNKKTEQTHLSLGTHAPSRAHPDRHAINLLNVIVGGNMSSRLFNEVREKRGLAYEISSQVKRYQDTGAFVVNAGLDPGKLNASVALILKELARIKKEGVTKGEFQRGREFYIGQLLLALEDTLDHMLYMGEHLMTLGRVHTPAQIVSEVDKVKREDLRKMARLVFRGEDLSMAVIGPHTEKEERHLRSLVKL